MNIPAIGLFKLVQTPAYLDVADKVIDPPGYLIEFSGNGFVQDHQISYMASCFHCDETAVKFKLEEFAGILRNQLKQGPFFWKGLGKLELVGGTINFYPEQPIAQLFHPVPAERVIRDQSLHTVLIGDKEVSTAVQDVAEIPKKKRLAATIIGWVLILISTAFICFHFYKHGFKPSSTGSQMKIRIEKAR